MLNKVQIIGNLGQDPEVRFTTSGQAVCDLSVATNEKWTDKQGEKHEHTEWHKVTVWGKTAELVGQYLKKGRRCYVEGKLQTQEYEKDGSKRWITKIIAQRVLFLDSARQERRGDDAPESQPPAGADDDIPFIHCFPGVNGLGIPTLTGLVAKIVL